MSYITNLEKKYLYLKNRNFSDRQILWRLLWANIVLLLSHKKLNPTKEDRLLHIAFRTNGGFGNVLIHANFINEFRQYVGYDNVEISVYAHPVQEISDAIFQGQNFVNRYYNYTDLSKHDFKYFDLVVDIHSFPEVLRADLPKIHAISPKLYHLVVNWNAFRRDDNYEHFFTLRPVLNSQIYLYSILNQKNCLNVADIGNNFLMKDYSIKIKIFKNENDVLGKYNLKKKGFITIQRGDPFSGTKEAPKMWPKKYYEQLIPQIKQPKCS